MTLVLIALLIQGLLGGLDNFWHHEMGGLPGRTSARWEIALHSVREFIYALVFLTIGWFAWSGAWAWVLAGLLVVEVLITLADFIEEDRTRRLPATERVLHTLLAIGFGIILALLAPIWWEWTRGETGFIATGYGWPAALCSLFGVGLIVWSIRNGLAAFSHRPVPAPVQRVASGRTVLITGATGFIGKALVAARLAQGDRVMVLARDILAARAQFGPRVLVYDELDQVPGDVTIDAIVNLAGAPVIAGLWTRRRRRALMASRIKVTQAVRGLIARMKTKPQVLVSGSAVGFYGDRGGQILGETSGPGHGFMAELCHSWEVEALRARDHGVRVCLLRMGMVFDWSGGPLPMMTLSNAFGLGAVFGDGRQGMPWIHRDDVIGMIGAAIACERYDGPVNAVAPVIITQGEFAAMLARITGRPLFARVPAALLRAMTGEFSDLFLASQKVSAERAASLGYVWAWPALEPLLARGRIERAPRLRRELALSAVTG